MLTFFQAVSKRERSRANMALQIRNESDWECDEQLLNSLYIFLLERLRLHPECDLSVMFVSEEEMERMHIEWMDLPGPTDVLSFPLDELEIPEEGEDASLGILGDIVMCPEVAKRQAEAADHSVEREAVLLIIHGVLHLLGLDHEEPQDRERMFRLQEALFNDFWFLQEGTDEEEGYIAL